MPLNVGDRLGHYEVTAQIGQGGMGEVYRAHPRFGRTHHSQISNAGPGQPGFARAAISQDARLWGFCCWSRMLVWGAFKARPPKKSKAHLTCGPQGSSYYPQLIHR